MSDVKRMPPTATDRETIDGWKEWHRQIRELLGTAVNERAVTMAAIKRLIKDRIGVPEWKPIETAPTNVKILAGFYDNKGKWFYTTVRKYDDNDLSGFTHWMPSPEPPNVR